MLHGRTTRASDVWRRRRVRWGARSAMKEIGPHTATTAATSPALSTRMRSRTRNTGNPSPCAMSSPNWRTFSGRAHSSASGMQTAAQGSTIFTCAQVRLARLPTRKRNSKLISFCDPRLMRIITLALRSAVKAAPVKTRRTGSFTWRIISVTILPLVSPPDRASQGIMVNATGRCRIVIAATTTVAPAVG